MTEPAPMSMCPMEETRKGMMEKPLSTMACSIHCSYCDGNFHAGACQVCAQSWGTVSDYGEVIR